MSVRKKKLILFDFDGVLIQSKLLHRQCLQFTANHFHLKNFPDSHARFCIGAQLQSQLSLIAEVNKVKIDLVQAEKVYRKAFQEHQSKLKVEPQMKTFLRAIMSRAEICIASNAPANKIHSILQFNNLENLFVDRVFSAHDLNCWKPDPGLFLHAINTLGYTKPSCLIIEDSLVGLQAAQSANIQSIHYNLEQCDSYEFANFVVYSTKELCRVVEDFIAN